MVLGTWSWKWCIDWIWVGSSKWLGDPGSVWLDMMKTWIGGMTCEWEGRDRFHKLLDVRILTFLSSVSGRIQKNYWNRRMKEWVTLWRSFCIRSFIWHTLWISELLCLLCGSQRLLGTTVVLQTQGDRVIFVVLFLLFSKCSAFQMLTQCKALKTHSTLKI